MIEVFILDSERTHSQQCWFNLKNINYSWFSLLHNFLVSFVNDLNLIVKQQYISTLLLQLQQQQIKMETEEPNLELSYDECIKKVNELQNTIKVLTEKNDLESLEETVTGQDYMELLANSIYSLHSVLYAYTLHKGVQMPAEFAKVKEYYMKAKNIATEPPVIDDKNKNPLPINKNAAHRIIKNSIN